MIELMNTATELMNLTDYSYHTVSHPNNSRTHSSKKILVKHNQEGYKIYKPRPTVLALLSNQAPRVFYLFQDNNYFQPTSVRYMLVSIFQILIYYLLKGIGSQKNDYCYLLLLTVKYCQDNFSLVS